MHTCYVIYAKCNAGGKMQKNIKKLILLARFYLNLGKKLKVHFSTPREWKCLKWWGPSCECPTTALGSKFICLSVSNISKTFCFENAGNKQHDLEKKKKIRMKWNRPQAVLEMFWCSLVDLFKEPLSAPAPIASSGFFSQSNFQSSQGNSLSVLVLAGSSFTPH